MPVEVRSRRQQTMAIGFGIAALVVAIVIAWGIIKLSGGTPSTRLRLGDDVFEAGNATRMSNQIHQDGPILFSDVSGRGQNRPIFVNHFGDDPELRWVAFDAVAPGAPNGCFLSWSTEREAFIERSSTSKGAGKVTKDNNNQKAGDTSPCRELTFPANGDGLTQYKWKVDEDGLLTIDFRKDSQKSGNHGQDKVNSRDGEPGD